MGTVKVVIAVGDAPAPVGQDYAKTVVTLIDSAGQSYVAEFGPEDHPDTGEDGTQSFTAEFDEVPAGSFSVTVHAVDQNGQPMGLMVSGSGTMPSPEPPQEGTFPQALSVTISIG